MCKGLSSLAVSHPHESVCVREREREGNPLPLSSRGYSNECCCFWCIDDGKCVMLDAFEKHSDKIMSELSDITSKTA